MSAYIEYKPWELHIVSATFGFTGHLYASIQIGLAATALRKSESIASITLVTIPLGSFGIDGLLSIVPQLQIDAGASISISDTGSFLAGAILDWSKIQANLDIIGKNSSGSSGLSPKITPVRQLSGTISTTVDLHLPVSLGVAIHVLNVWNKQIALVDTPGFSLTGLVSDHDGCDGIDISASVYNDVAVDLLDVTTITIATWTDKLFSTCLGNT